MNQVGVIAIGRNEGERLRRCLASVAGRGMTVVYVDSASTDDSVAFARSLGVEVVELDMSVPFSAARARNEGFARLMSVAPHVQFVQFIDGDCEVVDGWIPAALAAIEAQPRTAIVCGRRRERHPDASIYNRLADVEWATPVGEAKSCGGDALIRALAFREVGGYDATVVAGEEPEMCQRLRAKGWRIFRIDAEMTIHDSAMTRFGQWWKRQVRSGYGMMDVVTRFSEGENPLFLGQVKSARLWAILTPLMPLQALRLAWKRRHLGTTAALAYGGLTMIGKWGNVIGQRQYRRDRAGGRNTRLIDYKASGSPAAATAAR